ncbi:J domain-containing protein [Halorarius halobius]|uniref:J domain-containing protein n=1 Tax=Halorarius halobius TaxID=2962671 RepID=UPI0020CDFD0D|nr:J domain-containing protein [Halorarius halobius]
MVHEVLAGLPGWLVLGVALGLLASVVSAGVFAVGIRLFPTRRPNTAEVVDGDVRRRTEIRQYLTDIGEAFAEDHFVEGQEVAFYLPKRDVAITFDARAYYRIQRSPTYPVLVEHEMPGVNLGYRLPFETPEVTREASDADAAVDEPDTDPRDAAFSVLGLPSGASESEVKTAYREKVKEVHPDHGGDTDEFRRVREAYTTAKEHAST